MAFSDYQNIAQVQTQFQIKYQEEGFIAAQDVEPPQHFLAEFEFNRVNLDMFSSEGAREIIIFPILREAYKNYAYRYSLFVQRYLRCNEELSGTPDYIIATKSALGKTVLEMPVVVLAEAKKNDFEQDWGQCLAELVAAQRLNPDPNFPVYGIVTDGNLWQFGKLSLRRSPAITRWTIWRSFSAHCTSSCKPSQRRVINRLTAFDFMKDLKGKTPCSN